jgi:hypothetical protein
VEGIQERSQSPSPWRGYSSMCNNRHTAVQVFYGNLSRNNVSKMLHVLNPVFRNFKVREVPCQYSVIAKCSRCFDVKVTLCKCCGTLLPNATLHTFAYSLISIIISNVQEALTKQVSGSIFIINKHELILCFFKALHLLLQAIPR